MSIQDEALANKLRDALEKDKRISNLPIDVRVSEGEAFLKGVVDCQEQIDVAKFIAGGIAGVRHININELRIKGED